MIFVYDIANVVCRKSGCANKDVTLSVYMRSGGKVLCGVCNSTITDVTKTGTVSLDE